MSASYRKTTATNLDYTLISRAEDIAKVFSAFPDSHAVLYTTTGQEPLAVVVDRGDVYGAIENAIRREAGTSSAAFSRRRSYDMRGVA